VEEHRPLAPGERLDPNTASAAELARLPRIGMRLAKEILADRELRGFFGSAAELDRVAGIGPATVRRLEPFLRFGRAVPTPPRAVDINLATRAELETLPGIGPARAQAILAYRDKHGPFADRFALGRVPGIGRKLAEKLASEGRLR
jgi:competence protein ComEA